MMQWQTIDTVPLNKTVDLYFSSTGGREVNCQYYKPMNTNKGEGWMDDNDCFLINQNPSHWMIVTPPK